MRCCFVTKLSRAQEIQATKQSGETDASKVRKMPILLIIKKQPVNMGRGARGAGFLNKNLNWEGSHRLQPPIPTHLN